MNLLQKVRDQVAVAIETAVQAIVRLDRAEALIRRLGYCPECEKPLFKGRGRPTMNHCLHPPAT